MNDYRQIRVEHLAAVAVLTMNEPSTLNAASFDMALELTAALEAAARDGARCVVLTGAGRGFCSGANLSGEFDLHAPGYDAGQALDAYYHPLMRAIRDLPIPIVTAVNGAAAGIGCALALAGDIVVASETAYLLQAFEWGLVNRVVPSEELMPVALDLARRLADGPTVALGASRAQCWAATNASFDETLALERRQQRTAGRTSDHREGIAAFLEKRPTVFTGA